MTSSLHDTLLENRKVIKRLLDSDASIFCFFRLVNDKYPSFDYGDILRKEEDKKYDTLVITVKRHFHGHSEITFQLTVHDSEQIIEKNFKFSEEDIDDSLLEKIEQELKEEGLKPAASSHGTDFDGFSDKQWAAYYERKPEVYNQNEMSFGTLEESEIAEFIQLKDFDFNYYYKLYTREDFQDRTYYNPIEQSEEVDWHSNRTAWKVFRKFGLIIKKRWYTQQQSDYGSDNYYEYIIADPVYISNDKTKEFFYYTSPSGGSWRRDKFLKSVYDYFFGTKQMILAGFDDMPMCPTSKCWRSSDEYDFRDKLFAPPKSLLTDCFILSAQIDGREMREQFKNTDYE